MTLYEWMEILTWPFTICFCWYQLIEYTKRKDGLTGIGELASELIKAVHSMEFRVRELEEKAEDYK